jgi:uncharacterized DUF497 family protein
MVDFDPAKEAINLSKHGVSLARWVDLDIAVAFVDDRYDYGEVRYRAYGHIEHVHIAWPSPVEMERCVRSAFDACIQRR